MSTKYVADIQYSENLSFVKTVSTELFRVTIESLSLLFHDKPIEVPFCLDDKMILSKTDIWNYLSESDLNIDHYCEIASRFESLIPLVKDLKDSLRKGSFFKSLEGVLENAFDPVSSLYDTACFYRMIESLLSEDIDLNLLGTLFAELFTESTYKALVKLKNSGMFSEYGLITLTYMFCEGFVYLVVEGVDDVQ